MTPLLILGLAAVLLIVALAWDNKNRDIWRDD